MSAPRIREAGFGDLPQAASVATQAFWDDGLVGDRIHPFRESHPEDMDLYWLRRARVNFWNPRWKCLLAVVTDGDGEETVAGIAQWVRKGPGGDKLMRWWFDPRRYLVPVFSALMKLHALVWPNRACDPAEEDVIERAYPHVYPMWSGERAESWYLDLLAVRPAFQGRGIGRALVQPGLGWAEREGVSASVIVAAGKDPFYRKCGYDVQDGNLGMGEGNPLSGCEGQNMYWKMPKKTD